MRKTGYPPVTEPTPAAGLKNMGDRISRPFPVHQAKHQTFFGASPAERIDGHPIRIGLDKNLDLFDQVVKERSAQKGLENTILNPAAENCKYIP
jgi:hypothetical protein